MRKNFEICRKEWGTKQFQQIFLQQNSAPKK